ncbi:hypothetical protein D915_006549 [Fasciola hepatica]|uniref:Uncharacterized protein n=1 Tax=Fasciola hepatica TaxID=6192 RepID=A0A4E0R4B3_FASHE|nr:hypothetical protein D915_006549 [Fasciola hepatica]
MLFTTGIWKSVQSNIRYRSMDGPLRRRTKQKAVWDNGNYHAFLEEKPGKHLPFKQGGKKPVNKRFRVDQEVGALAIAATNGCRLSRWPVNYQSNGD